MRAPLVYVRLGYVPLSVLAAYAVAAVSVLFAEVLAIRATNGQTDDARPISAVSGA